MLMHRRIISNNDVLALEEEEDKSASVTSPSRPINQTIPSCHPLSVCVKSGIHSRHPVSVGRPNETDLEN
ncbi:hypothetical protein Pcinc_003441 [Petrolisthes cinctipes]|uniref:Uncharacterized protein n=1 Tax=Petrolisthes cinctipes TaxID=88211 RepID=A0AAE1GJ05_PETCI|nr:hypothetical protein Pcinc_003441 [Petrolisthes cinctipes]